eukprot:EC838790.1.p2 GENE.EC838790.1~~EC838790.1.p2  ORF type:complete len:157 (+),score=45.10 EC838790.1:175-645(+)
MLFDLGGRMRLGRDHLRKEILAKRMVIMSTFARKPKVYVECFLTPRCYPYTLLCSTFGDHEEGEFEVSVLADQPVRLISYNGMEGAAPTASELRDQAKASAYKLHSHGTASTIPKAVSPVPLDHLRLVRHLAPEPLHPRRVHRVPPCRPAGRAAGP